MAKRIFFLIDRLALLATQQGGFASKQELVKTLTIASQQAFNACLPAKSQRAIGPGLNRQLDTRILPFLREIQYGGTGAPLPATGRFTLPYPGYVSFYDVEGAVTVEEVTGHAWRHKLADPIEGPDATHLIVRDVEGGNPMTPGKQIVPVPEAMVVNLYCYPTEPVYFEDYTSGRPVYDDNQSVDTGWDVAMEPELLVRSLRLLGLEIRDPALMQVAAQLTAETL